MAIENIYTFYKFFSEIEKKLLLFLPLTYVSYKSLSIVSYITLYLLLFTWTYAYHTSLEVL